MQLQVLVAVVCIWLAGLVESAFVHQNWTRPSGENVPAIPSTVLPAIMSIPPKLIPFNFTKFRNTSSLAFASGLAPSTTAAGKLHCVDNAGGSMTITKTVTVTVLGPSACGATALPASSAPFEAAMHTPAVEEPSKPSNQLDGTIISSVTASAAGNESQDDEQAYSGPRTVTSTTTTTSTSTVTLIKTSTRFPSKSDAAVTPAVHVDGSNVITTTLTSVSTFTVTMTRFGYKPKAENGQQPASTEPSLITIISRSTILLTKTTTLPTRTPLPLTTAAPYYQILGAGGWNATNPIAQFKVSSVLSDVPQSQGIVRREMQAIMTATIKGRVVTWAKKLGGGVRTTLDPPAPVGSQPTGSTDPVLVANANAPINGFIDRDVKHAATTTGPPSDEPMLCGEHGSFTIHFDDLPSYVPRNGTTKALLPVFNPNHHFFFSGGWLYGPARSSLYTATSAPHLAVFDPSIGAAPGSIYAGLIPKGGFGAGPRANQRAFWFHVYSAHFGCGTKGLNQRCVVTVSAIQYSATTGKEIIHAKETFYLPPCSGEKKCPLTEIKLGRGFRGLSAIVFAAEVDGTPVPWVIDDLKMVWYDNSCAAGLERLRSR